MMELTPIQLRPRASENGQLTTQVSHAYRTQLPLVSATAEISGGTLMIIPDDGFAGRFQVTVSVTDGMATTSESFMVTVTNTAPSLNLSDQTIPHKQQQLEMMLSAVDADEDTRDAESSNESTYASHRLCRALALLWARLRQRPFDTSWLPLPLVLPGPSAKTFVFANGV